MRLADQWRELVEGLPQDWGDARLTLSLDDDTQLDRAAALLAPLTPGRSGRTIRFYSARGGAGPGPEAVRRALRRLDAEGIRGTLELAATGEPAAPTVAPTVERASLLSAWDAAVGALPPDWSDVYGEVELRSTDHLDRAALLLSPANPTRAPGRPAFRFRVARRFGYGVSAAMMRRCLERCDEANIAGSVQILRALSDTNPVQTQGPVWYVGGRTV